MTGADRIAIWSTKPKNCRVIGYLARTQPEPLERAAAMGGNAIVFADPRWETRYPSAGETAGSVALFVFLLTAGATATQPVGPVPGVAGPREVETTRAIVLWCPTPLGATRAPFSPAAAARAFDAALTRARACTPTPPAGATSVQVTLRPAGDVECVELAGAVAGTDASPCVIEAFQKMRVPAFDGDAVVVDDVSTDSAH